MNEFPELRAALLAAVERVQQSPEPTPERELSRFRSRGRRRSPWRPRQLRVWAIPTGGVLVAAVVVVIVALSAGTSAQDGSSTAATASRSASPSMAGPAWRLRGSVYAFAVGGDTTIRTPSVQATSGILLFRADQVLRERCMRQRGFRYMRDPTPKTTDLPSATGFPSTFYPEPIGSTYPESALLVLREREGFGIASSSSSHRDPDPDDQYVSTLSRAQRRRWIAAFAGRNGCFGNAAAQLYGNRRAANLEADIPTMIYNYLNTAVYTRNGAISPENQAITRTVAAWSTCMAARTGKAWPNENVLIAQLTEPQATGGLGRERKLAVADAECAYSSGQAAAFAAAFHHAADHLPGELQAGLEFLLAHRAAWVARARTILSSPSS